VKDETLITLEALAVRGIAAPQEVKGEFHDQADNVKKKYF
jgi:hypothetical protein